MNDSVLLDTSFFIRLLNEKDVLHKNALGYFKYFLENNYTLNCSTISIAEYCVKGNSDELPWKNLRIVPFNYDHAIKAGKFARIVFDNRGSLDSTDRNIIPNDSKLFAQAEIEPEIKHFVTSDQKCINVHKTINQAIPTKFDIINIRTPYNELFGLLDFGED